MKTYELNLFKISPWYNPLYVSINNNSYELNDIKFYDDSGVVIDVSRGWFGDSSFNVSIATSKPIKRKIKLDFSKKIPFIIKSKCSYATKYDLFIPISDVFITTTYQRTNTGILAKYKFIDMNDNECSWEHYVKIFSSIKYNTLIPFQKEVEKLNKLSIYDNIPEEEFKEIINNWNTLYNDYQKTLKDIEEYTVEDYFNEIKDNN